MTGIKPCARCGKVPELTRSTRALYLNCRCGKLMSQPVTAERGRRAEKAKLQLIDRWNESELRERV